MINFSEIEDSLPQVLPSSPAAEATFEDDIPIINEYLDKIAGTSHIFYYLLNLDGMESVYVWGIAADKIGKLPDTKLPLVFTKTLFPSESALPVNPWPHPPPAGASMGPENRQCVGSFGFWLADEATGESYMLTAAHTFAATDDGLESMSVGAIVRSPGGGELKRATKEAWGKLQASRSCLRNAEEGFFTNNGTRFRPANQKVASAYAGIIPQQE